MMQANHAYGRMETVWIVCIGSLGDLDLSACAFGGWELLGCGLRAWEVGSCMVVDVDVTRLVAAWLWMGM